MKLVRRGGEYFRVADPRWTDPLDGSFSAERGGRWNPPGTFPVVYFNATIQVARANVARRFKGMPFGPEDMDPVEAPVLVTATVPDALYVDAVTTEGLAELGLPSTYPVDDDGRTVPHERCRPIGARAWESGERGIVCRTTALPEIGDEELAWFQREHSLEAGAVASFDAWFW
ncbi:MAG: RES domain-containing protein [Actinomycetota bacterium]